MSHGVRPVRPSAPGCEDCLRTGDAWVHLRICMTCGHVGCCDSSKNKHATAHHHATGHPDRALARAGRALGLVLRRRSDARVDAHVPADHDRRAARARRPSRACPTSSSTWLVDAWRDRDAGERAKRSSSPGARRSDDHRRQRRRASGAAGRHAALRRVHVTSPATSPACCRYSRMTTFMGRGVASDGHAAADGAQGSVRRHAAPQPGVRPAPGGHDVGSRA